jgi:hypothetical protein
MPTNQRCSGRTARGEPCNATPRQNGLCLWHDPELEDAAREARKLGGQRRKREVAIRGAYDVEGLTSIPEIRRIVEIAVADLLGMENSLGRDRALLSAAQTAARLLETGEFEERLATIEGVLEPRLKAVLGGRR